MQSQEQQVPPQYKCPICGKWGRSHHSERDIPYGYLYCNPKARTGGKGCGEVFKHLRVPACSMIRVSIEVSKAEKNERIRKMGFRMVAAMKESGAHQPMQRTCTWNYVYRHISETDGNCDCGCGNPKANQRSRFATNVCADVVFSAAAMIASQGATLQKFLIELRGCKCEKCEKETQALEVDHILEVANGGGLCWIDNYQLLCIECHKAKTAKFAADRASARRMEKAAQNPQLSIF